MSRSGMAAPDIERMVQWIASLRCPWCSAPDDAPPGTSAFRAIEVRRTRIDAQCGSCAFVVSFSAAEVRRFWERQPANRRFAGLIPVPLSRVEEIERLRVI